MLEYLAPLGQKSALAQGPDDSSGENITYDVRPPFHIISVSSYCSCFTKAEFISHALRDEHGRLLLYYFFTLKGLCYRNK